MDAAGDFYCITQDNQLLKFYTGDLNPLEDPVATDYIDLSVEFPEFSVFLGLTADENGNVYVSTGYYDGYDDFRRPYVTQSIYRVDALENVTAIASNIAAPITPYETEYSISGTGDRPDRKTYLNALTAGSDHVFGLNDNGYYFRISQDGTSSQTYRPRYQISAIGAAVGKTNAYGISGRRIVELRPDMSTDYIVGTLPSSIPTDFVPNMLMVNDDATIFYLIYMDDYSYFFDIYSVSL